MACFYKHGLSAQKQSGNRAIEYYADCDVAYLLFERYDDCTFGAPHWQESADRINHAWPTSRPGRAIDQTSA